MTLDVSLVVGRLKDKAVALADALEGAVSFQAAASVPFQRAEAVPFQLFVSLAATGWMAVAVATAARAEDR